MSTGTEPGDDPRWLSVIVPTFNSAETIEQCLDALAAQTTKASEVIVVDSGSDATADLVASRYAWVKLVRSEVRLYPGAARNLGVKHSSGALLAFLDSDCLANAQWVARILKVHREQEHGVVGGPVAADEPLSPLGWAAYLCSFLHWLPGTPETTVTDIPTCSFSVSRSVFDRIGGFRESGFSSDTEFNWLLGRQGGELLLDPQLHVRHLDQLQLSGFLRRQFARGRAFAGMRCSVRELPLATRSLLAATMPALPFLLSWRLVRKLGRSATPSSYRLGLAKAWPLVLVGFTLWSAGEAIGYLTKR